MTSFNLFNFNFSLKTEAEILNVRSRNIMAHKCWWQTESSRKKQSLTGICDQVPFPITRKCCKFPTSAHLRAIPVQFSVSRDSVYGHNWTHFDSIDNNSKITANYKPTWLSSHTEGLSSENCKEQQGQREEGLLHSPWKTRSRVGFQVKWSIVPAPTPLTCRGGEDLVGPSFQHKDCRPADCYVDVLWDSKT